MLPHEQTTPKATTDRLDLTRATEANLSPIWGLSLAGGPGRAARRARRAARRPDRRRRRGAPRSSASTTRPASGPSTPPSALAPVVIADGHHRYEVARTYRDERRAATGGRPGPWDLTLAFVVELAEDQLVVQAIHRLRQRRSPTASTSRRRWRRASRSAGAEPDHARSSPGAMRERGALCLVAPDGARPLPAAPRRRLRRRRATSTRPASTRRWPTCRATVTYQHGVDNVAGRLSPRRGADYGVLLRPVTVDQIAATAERERAHAAEVDVLRAEAEDRPASLALGCRR